MRSRSLFKYIRRAASLLCNLVAERYAIIHPHSLCKTPRTAFNTPLQTTSNMAKARDVTSKQRITIQYLPQ